jgi:hypothetical protein
MGRRDKLLLRFLSKPKDFTWQELVSLHRPHPGPVLKRYQVEQIEEVLRGEGLI